MSKDRTVISIWINLADETERKILDHIHSKGNRSKYIKRLIYDDMMGVRNTTPGPTNLEENTTDEDLDSMKSFF